MGALGNQDENRKKAWNTKAKLLCQKWQNQSMDMKKTQAGTKHYNENIMTIVVPRVKMDFYWLPKASEYASAFMSIF